MKTLLIAALLFAPLIASAGEPNTVTAKSQMRGALMMSFAKAYSVNQSLLGAEAAYAIACRDAKSYTTLSMVDMFIAPALAEKKTISSYLGAVGIPQPDGAANQAAKALVFQLEKSAANLAKIMESAKLCEDFMIEKDRALDAADPEGDDMTWDAARQHAGINVMRLKEFDLTAELKIARTLVEKTK